MQCRAGYPAGGQLSSSFLPNKLICFHSGPYDAIHVGAASATLPQRLVDQLKAPGRMFIPVGVYNQAVWQVDKDSHGEVTKKELMGVMVSDRTFDLPELGD